MIKVPPAFTLRPLLTSDAPRIAAVIGDWEVVRWLASPPYPYTRADAERFLATVIPQHDVGRRRTEAIVIDGLLAGVIGIEPNSRGLNLGYWLGRAHWGQGVMTAAAQTLVGDFFAKPGDMALNSGYFSGNEASSAIQRRLGFEFDEDKALFNRPHGRTMPHVFTRLTRERFQRFNTQSRPG